MDASGEIVLAGLTQEDAPGFLELFRPSTRRSDRHPSLSAYVIHADDTVIIGVRDVDASGCVHEEAARKAKLLDPAAARAVNDPPGPAYVVHLHYATVAAVSYIDVHSERRRPCRHAE